MQVTQDELLTEAGQMALELRLKDRRIAALEAEVQRLCQALADARAPAEPQPSSNGKALATTGKGSTDS